LGELVKLPPDDQWRPKKAGDEEREHRQAERNELASRIARAEENLLFVEDARTRKSLDAKVSEMRDRLEKLDAELKDTPNEKGRSKDVEEILARLQEEFDSWNQNAVDVPLYVNGSPVIMQTDPADPNSTAYFTISANAIKVNETLHQLGCEVRLRWKSEGVVKRYQRKDKNGQLQNVTSCRHALVRGRFRLGQRQGLLPGYVLGTPGWPRPWAGPRRGGGRWPARRPGPGAGGRSRAARCSRRSSRRPRPSGP
jgi:hypothetical protein